jgi:xanthine dehydrogenase small subunit
MNTSAPDTAARPHTVHLIRRGQVLHLENVPPTRTLLEVLREDLRLTSVKEGCGEGDCGACTVLIAQADAAAPSGVRFRPINSCIRLAHSVNNMAVWTAQDLDSDPLLSNCGHAHPVQTAMKNCHASQCGFCTPGFVMSLFGMYLAKQQAQDDGGTPAAITRSDAQRDLSGNLCRCTGYRPIFDAAMQMQALPASRLDTAGLRAQLDSLQAAQDSAPETAVGNAYMRPTTLARLLALRAEHPQAQIVAGCTDVGLWITKQHRQFAQVLDLTAVHELQQIVLDEQQLRIGAAVTLEDAFAAMRQHWPSMAEFTERFAGLPVRSSGTLGGNVANGSPIGDAMPLLIALGASVVLSSVRGERSLALEDLYTGYRQNRMAQDEVLSAIVVPLPATGKDSDPSWLQAYKVSKRHDDDISAVCLAIDLRTQGGVVSSVRIGAGGVAATPARARQTESALLGKPWSEASVQGAMVSLQAEFSPISDMRASADYRKTVLAQLLWRFWLQSQTQSDLAPQTCIRLADVAQHL